VKRLANDRHRDYYIDPKTGDTIRVQPEPQPIAQSTPFENVRDVVEVVMQLEIRVTEIANKLLGAMPEQQSDSRDLPPSNGAPIFELNEHASDITAAVRRMHEVLDRFNPVLPA
jgi:hypothetical protein